MTTEERLKLILSRGGERTVIYHSTGAIEIVTHDDEDAVVTLGDLSMVAIVLDVNLTATRVSIEFESPACYDSGHGSGSVWILIGKAERP